jgi:hypothetical protein
VAGWELSGGAGVFGKYGTPQMGREPSRSVEVFRKRRSLQAIGDVRSFIRSESLQLARGLSVG